LKIQVSFVSELFNHEKVDALVDSGATHNFISRSLAQSMGLLLRQIPKPRIVRNVDGTINKQGNITHYVDLCMRTGIPEGKDEYSDEGAIRQRFFIAHLGTDHLILGYPWLAAENLSLDWNHPDHSLQVYATKYDTFYAAAFTLNKGDQMYMRLRKATHAQELAEKAAHDDLGKQVDRIPPELRSFSKIFSETAAHRFPEPKRWDHGIELLPDAPDTLDCKVYPLTKAEQDALDKFLEEHLAKHYIRTSSSPYAAPFFFVKKKDGKLRPVQDYRRLNQWTKKNRYPLPLIAELVEKVPGHDWYTTMDVRWGYNNVRIKDGDQWKAAFKTNRGLYEPMVMFFGLTNSPATFQTMMDDIFRSELAEGWLKVYMDDILVATNGTKAEHFDRVRSVLRKLQSHDLFLKPEKCPFAQKSVQYLGVVITSEGVEMDAIKLQGILDWPAPTSVTEVRSFLGFGNFYKPFIADYAKLARPLHDLTKKGVPFSWGPAQSGAFAALKDCFASRPVLATINYDRPFRLQADASAFATGAVLSQQDDMSRWRPVAFFSGSLLPAEVNYDIYDRELLAIVKALKHWRHHLLGARHMITILTDHRNLTYFREPHKISPRQARWREFLLEFDFVLVHVPGSTNDAADFLSRHPDFKAGVNFVNHDVTVLPDELFSAARIFLAENDVEGRKRALFELHNTPSAGHLGINNTWALVSDRYEGPKLWHFVEEYVRGCPSCQMNKVQRAQGHAPTQYLDVHPDEGPFQYVSMDLITDLPTSGKYDAILTIVDQGCSKATKFIPCTKTITGEGVATLYLRHLFPWFGVPKRVISDRDPRFTSAFATELCAQTGVQQNLSSSFHPHTDGQMERMNAWIEQYLRHWVSQQGQNDWTQYLSTAEYAHNSWPHDVTKKTPHELLFGMRPSIHIASDPDVRSPRVAERLLQLQEGRLHAAEALLKRYRIREPRHQLQEGDLVWLDGRNLSLANGTKKLAPKRYGPFRITKKISSVAYRLDLPTTLKIHNVFHLDLLSPYNETAQYGPAFVPPPPDLINGQEEQEVEAILNKRKRSGSGTTQYLVKWKGFPSSENEWVDKTHMHADHLIKQFEAARPTKGMAKGHKSAPRK